MANVVDIIIVVSVLLLVSGVLFFMLRRKGHCTCDKCSGRRRPCYQGDASNEDQGAKSEGACTHRSSQCMMHCNGCALMGAQHMHHSVQGTHHSVQNAHKNAQNTNHCSVKNS